MIKWSRIIPFLMLLAVLAASVIPGKAARADSDAVEAQTYNNIAITAVNRRATQFMALMEQGHEKGWDKLDVDEVGRGLLDALEKGDQKTEAELLRQWEYLAVRKFAISANSSDLSGAGVDSFALIPNERLGTTEVGAFNICYMTVSHMFNVATGRMRVHHIATCAGRPVVAFGYQSQARALETTRTYDLERFTKTRQHQVPLRTEEYDQREYNTTSQYAHEMRAGTEVTAPFSWFSPYFGHVFNKRGKPYPTVGQQGRPGAVPFPTAPYNPPQTANYPLFEAACRDYYQANGWSWPE